MITVTLKNGQTLNFPDGTDQNVMKSAIQKNFPDQVETPMGEVENVIAKDAANIREGKPPTNTQMAKPPQSNGRMALDKFHDALRNLGAGAVESGYNAASAFKPSINKNRPDIQKMFGVQNKNEVIQKIPEMATAFIPGGLAAKALSKAPALAKALGIAIEQGAIQGGLGYLFNTESRKKSGLKAGGTTAAAQLGIDALTSRHPVAKAARYVAPRLAGGMAGEKFGESAGLPASARIGLGVAGALGGGAAASAIPKLLGAKNVHAMGYAQDVVDATKNMDQTKLKSIQEASKRRGVTLTPGEMTQDPVLLAKEAKAGANKANVRTRHALEEGRAVNEAKINEEFKRGVYNPKEHDALQKEAFDAAKPQKVPLKLLPKEHHDLYDKALKFAKRNPELSSELNNSVHGSVGQFDVIRRSLDKMIKSEAGSKFNLTKARTDLSKTLKDFSPDYKTAMSLSEKEKVVKTIDALANKGKLTGETFFKGIEDKKKFDSLLKHTRDVEGADQFLKDARMLYEKRKSVDTTALAKKLSDSVIPTSKTEAQTFIAKLFNGKSDKEMLKLMYDPEAMKKVHQIAARTEPEQAMIELSKILSRKKAQDVARTK